MRATKIELGSVSREYNLAAYPDARSLFRYEMHTLPSEISDAIGTSTLWAAWNAAVYVAQIDDGRLSAALADRAYLDATQAVLREHGGLWFWDYDRPVVLVVYRDDHKFLLDQVRPRRGAAIADYDLVIASQPYRARAPVEFKAKRILAPLTRALAPGGRLIVIHSHGDEIGLPLLGLMRARQCSERKGCRSVICCSNSCAVVPVSATSCHIRPVAAAIELGTSHGASE